MNDKSKTQPLPTNWRQNYSTVTIDTRRRHPRNTASMAVTTLLTVIA
jgi:hypothetical protein